MSSVINKERVRAGAGVAARGLVAKEIVLAMAAGATVSDSFQVPEGSWLNSIHAEVATAFSGAPTNINLRVGSAAAGQEVVADVDVKAQGHTLCTIVAAFDKQAGVTTYYFRLAATGGTNPAGTAKVVVSYYPPNP